MRRTPLTARGRIVGWMLLTVTIALAGSILAVWQVVTIRADDMASDRIASASENFRNFTSSSDAQDIGTVNGVLTRFLQTVTPYRSETMFTIVDDAPHRRLPGHVPLRFDTDSQFVAEAGAATEPIHKTLRDTEEGTVQYAVIPVNVAGDSATGQLVIVVFEDELAAPLFEAVWLFGIVAVGALLLATVVSWLVAGRVLAPIRLVRATADKISETDLTRRIPVEGKDDVADLAQTFNHMLDRLENAFSSQRRFIDDAGHELRTPITVVRGHLELMSDDPEDRQHTIELVTDELARMSRIVEELLLLARADQPDFIRKEPVNLTDLTVDVYDHARMLGHRHWEIENVAEATVMADEQRLTQALMQLAANAVTHTQDGDRIAVGSRVDAGRVYLWVADQGAGIAEQDQRVIFERFQRGERRRGDGAGLGLAIVLSIAEGHGGTVTVDSEFGVGSRFIIEIPEERIEPGA